MKEARIVRSLEGEPIAIPNGTCTIKGTRSDGDTRYLVCEISADPGFEGPGLHTHPNHLETFYILEGDFQWQLDGKSVETKAGSYIEIPAGMVHSFRNVGPRRAKLLGVICPDELSLFGAGTN